MHVKHLGKSPTVHPTAWVAPNAVLRSAERHPLTVGTTASSGPMPTWRAAPCTGWNGQTRTWFPSRGGSPKHWAPTRTTSRQATRNVATPTHRARAGMPGPT